MDVDVTICSNLLSQSETKIGFFYVGPLNFIQSCKSQRPVWITILTTFCALVFF